MIFRSHIARNTILWPLVAIVTSTTRAESDTSEAFATVRQYLDAFNKGDVKAMSSLFAHPVRSLTERRRICGRGLAGAWVKGASK